MIIWRTRSLSSHYLPSLIPHMHLPPIRPFPLSPRFFQTPPTHHNPSAKANKTTKAWYKTVDPTDKWDHVLLEGIEDVAGLKKAIKKEMAPELDAYRPGRLTIKAKKNRDDDDGTAVELDEVAEATSVLKEYGIWLSVSVTPDRTTLKSYEGIKKTLKYHPPKDTVLLSSLGCDWEYQRPEHWREPIGEALQVQYNSLNKKRLDKNTAPLFLMLSGAGTGKSRNAKEFHDTLIEFAKSQELKDRLKKAKVFLITLENGETPVPEETAKGVHSVISARMLAQVRECPLSDVLCYPDLPTPDQLCRQLAENENIAFKDFTAIIVVDGVGCLLSSNEDRKNKNSPFYSVLTVCADLALQGAFIIPLCTATITGPPRQFLAATNRRRVYLELPPLDPPVIKASGKPAFPTGLVNNLLVGDCGGHGRALEAVYELQQDGGLENLTSYDDLVSVISSGLKAKYGDAFERQPNEYIAILKLAEGNGLVRFEPEMANEGYLSVPFIWIKTFASIYDKIKENYPISRFLANFLRYYEQIGVLRNDPVKMQEWQLFENFAAGFRVLKSLSFDEGQRVKLSQIHYGATRYGDDLEFINHQMEHVQSTKKICTRSCQSPPVEVNCTKMSFGKSQAETIKAHLPSLTYCAVNGNHTRGGDIFNLLEVSGSDRKVMEAGQCKRAEYVNPSSLWGEVKKATPAGGVFVFYTTANLTDVPDTSMYCTSFFVTKDNYQKYFGPFAGRAFLRSRESMEPTSEMDMQGDGTTV